MITETMTAKNASTGIQVWLIKDELAFATFSPAELRGLTFTSTYGTMDPDSPAPKQHGYQRDPMNERFPRIGKYYIANPSKTTPLIISVRLDDPDEIEEFEKLLENRDYAAIHSRWSDAVVSVVDGQHRQGGLIWAFEQDGDFAPPVPVMMYFGLTYEAEAEIFDIINTEQRKLPKALIETTKGDIVDKGSLSHAQQVREVAFSLARDVDSVWYEQINMTGARDRDRKVTYEGLRRSTSNMLPAELIQRIEARGESPIDFAKYYWQLVKTASLTAWNETQPMVRLENGDLVQAGSTVEIDGEKRKIPAVDYRLKDLVGVASLAKLGEDIISSALEHKSPRDRMAELVSKLSEVDWRKLEDNPWMRSQAGFAGQKEMYNVLYALVYLDKKPGESGS